MKALVEAFNQEKALVGAFSVIVQLHRLIVYSTINYPSSRNRMLPEQKIHHDCFSVSEGLQS